MMTSSRRKLAALIVAVATPGSLMFSCSGQLTRDFRDAAFTGAADFVTQGTFNLLDSWVVFEPNDEPL